MSDRPNDAMPAGQDNKDVRWLEDIVSEGQSQPKPMPMPVMASATEQPEKELPREKEAKSTPKTAAAPKKRAVKEPPVAKNEKEPKAAAVDAASSEASRKASTSSADAPSGARKREIAPSDVRVVSGSDAEVTRVNPPKRPSAAELLAQEERRIAMEMAAEGPTQAGKPKPPAKKAPAGRPAAGKREKTAAAAGENVSVSNAANPAVEEPEVSPEQKRFNETFSPHHRLAEQPPNGGQRLADAASDEAVVIRLSGQSEDANATPEPAEQHKAGKEKKSLMSAWKERRNTEKASEAEAASENGTKSALLLFLNKPMARMSLTLFLITALTALLLACVNQITAPKIDQLQQEAVAQAIEEVLAGSDQTDEVDGLELPKTVNHVYALQKNGAFMGYAVEASPVGFGGEIRLMVGVLPDGTVSGVSIVELSETPGLGTKVQDESFLSQFVGQSDGWTLERGGDGPVVAISGATVSSTAVADGVLASVRAALPLLQNQAEGGNNP